MSLDPFSKDYHSPLRCNDECLEGFQIGGFQLVSDNTIRYQQYFFGIIDEVRVWKIARTQKQIKESMNITLEKEKGLLYYWRFDEGIGTLVVSNAQLAYGTLGGGIAASEPHWVKSNSPLTASFSNHQEKELAVSIVVGNLIGIAFVFLGFVVGVCFMLFGSRFHYVQPIINFIRHIFAAKNEL